MSLPTSEPLSNENEAISPARQRRRRRMIVPAGADERAAFAADLAHRLTPSFDFFLFTAIAGLTLAAALLLDAPALFVLAALLAPFMAPAVGLGLATILGSVRFFLQSLSGMLIGSLIVFIWGLAAGWLSHLWPDAVHAQASLHTVFTLPDFTLVTLGAALGIYQLVRAPQQRPLVASVALAYSLYLPIGSAGFGLTGDQAGLWPDGLIVFFVHLGWIALVCTIVLALLGLRPLTFFGYTLASTLALAGVVTVIALSGLGTALQTNVALPPPPPTATASTTPTPSITPTPLPPTATGTPTKTLIPTQTHTPTITSTPPLVYGKVYARGDEGAIMRKEPSFSSPWAKSMLNGQLLIILPESVKAEGVTWLHVRFPGDGTEGWIVQTLILIETPTPAW